MFIPDNQFKALQGAKKKLKPRYPLPAEEVFKRTFDKLLHAFIPGIKIYWKRKSAGIMDRIVIGRDVLYPQLLKGRVMFVLWGKEFVEYDIDQLLEQYELRF